MLSVTENEILFEKWKSEEKCREYEMALFME